MVVRSGVEPGGIVPSDGSPGSWYIHFHLVPTYTEELIVISIRLYYFCRNLWILGMVISVVLPFWKSKWGPLLKLKSKGIFIYIYIYSSKGIGYE